MEQTLFICRSVDVFMPVPPRTARGFVSGEWLIENKIATTRIRVIAIDNELEVRLEDLESGEIFGSCPVPRGQREAAVENAVDSSRNFVLRIVDPATNRHAFLGINFSERSNAFDFNVALSDFEKRTQREDELKRAAVMASGGSVAMETSGDPSSSSSSPSKPIEMSPEAAVLYQKHDFTLKEGEHFKVEVKKSAASAASGGFLSRLGTNSGGGGVSSTGIGGSIGKLAPPLIPPPPSSSSSSDDPFNAAAFQHTGAALASATTTAMGTEAVPAPAAEAAKVVASSEEGWATF